MPDTTILDVNVAMHAQGVLGRRGFLRTVAFGAAGLAAAPFTDLVAASADDLRKRQMACIMLWMGGGPSQMDTFDPKPGTSNGGETKAIATAVSGIQIANFWPQTAKMMKDIALIRSMTNKEGNHERASYQLHTGYSPSGTVKHPAFGCVAAAELGDPKFDLPHIVSIGGGNNAVGAGMLGASYEPFLVANAEKLPENVAPPVPLGRFNRRLGLLSSLEGTGFSQIGGMDRVREHSTVYKQTAGMVLSPRMKAFDLEQEDAKTRAAYGPSPFGQGCLLARRLVQAGVTFVEVRLGGWDMHDDVQGRMAKLAAQTDAGFGSLLADLKSKGMLDKTLVVWMGEFGRTPKINPKAGRDHFPRVFNVALAGGGIKGGQVIGSSNPEGTDVKERPVTVPDLLQTFCHSLKIDPKKENMSPLGRPIKIVDGGTAVKELFA
jgi:hypothetical protein